MCERLSLATFTAVVSLLFVSACDGAPSPTETVSGTDGTSEFVALASKEGQGGTGAASAFVNFGDHEAGSPFPPAQHDESFHAKDKIVPRTVVIEEGGEVTFDIGPFHQVAIFEPGTEPEDIDATETTSDPALPPPLERITFDDGRVDLSPGPADTHQTWTTAAGTFDQPGVYLMICTTNLHFLEARMYGWIRVRASSASPSPAP